MGSISTNDTHLPIQIVTAGDSKDVTISLTKTNLESNVSIFYSIEVHPIKYASEVVFGKYLHSNTLDYGKYNVFIDTTNLTQGYYELSFSEDI